MNKTKSTKINVNEIDDSMNHGADGGEPEVFVENDSDDDNKINKVNSHKGSINKVLLEGHGRGLGGEDDEFYKKPPEHRDFDVT
jgi:hypothetical protein